MTVRSDGPGSCGAAGAATWNARWPSTRAFSACAGVRVERMAPGRDVLSLGARERRRHHRHHRRRRHDARRRRKMSTTSAWSSSRRTGTPSSTRARSRSSTVRTPASAPTATPSRSTSATRIATSSNCGITPPDGQLAWAHGHAHDRPAHHARCRRRLRLQDPAWRARGRRPRPRRPDRRRADRRARHRRRCRRLDRRARPGGRRHGGLLHPCRRRSLRLGPDRCGQRAFRRLRHGRQAGPRRQSAVLAAREGAVQRRSRGATRRARRRGGSGLHRRRRPQHR